MILFQACKLILLLYVVSAAVILITHLVMEYINQRRAEILRDHAKPTVASVLNTLPEYLLKSLRWPLNITRYF